jgi:hypothetical protein
MKAVSHSSSPLLAALLSGPLRHGAVLSAHHLRFDGYVVSLTRPGAARLPNGIECDVRPGRTDHVVVGGGELVVGRTVVGPGRPWNPVPTFEMPQTLPPGPPPNVGGAEVVAGYVAGLVLLHGLRKRALRISDMATLRTDALTTTLLRHASLGEVPEPVHALLASGAVRPLFALGAGSGLAWLRGLVSAGYVVDVDRLSTPLSLQPETSSVG